MITKEVKEIDKEKEEGIGNIRDIETIIGTDQERQDERYQEVEMRGE